MGMALERLNTFIGDMAHALTGNQIRNSYTELLYNHVLKNVSNTKYSVKNPMIRKK